MQTTPLRSEATLLYSFTESLELRKLQNAQTIAGGFNTILRKVLWELPPQDHPRATVSASDVEFYKQQGYLVCPGLIPVEMIEEAKQKIQTGVDLGVDRSTLFSREFQNWTKEYKEAPEIMRLFSETPVHKNCEALVGCAILAPKQSQIALRQPRPDGKKDFTLPEIDWHVDAYGQWTAGWFASIVMVVLSDWEEDNMGNFIAYPKSQFQVSQLLNEMSGSEFRDAMRNCHPLGIEPLQIHAKAGDVIFTHPLLAHDIAPNLSDKVRWAVLFRPSAIKPIEERHKFTQPEDPAKEIAM